MITILEETENGRLDGEPEAMDEKGLLAKSIADMMVVRATLLLVSYGEATWEVESGERITAGKSGCDVLDETEFRSWSRMATQTLLELGRNPKELTIPGNLSWSKNAGVVIGWKEDEDHPDALLLSIGEVMLG